MTILRVEHDIADNKRSGFSTMSKGFSLRTFSKKASRLVTGLIKNSKQTVKGQDRSDQSPNYAGEFTGMLAKVALAVQIKREDGFDGMYFVHAVLSLVPSQIASNLGEVLRRGT
jgi:hypothetical protein